MNNWCVFVVLKDLCDVCVQTFYIVETVYFPGHNFIEAVGVSSH